MLRTEVMPRMPESVLFSETLEATASEVTEAVKAQGLEGVIAGPGILSYLQKDTFGRELKTPTITLTHRVGLTCRLRNESLEGTR